MTQPPRIVRPKRGSWIVLVVATSPIWGFAIYAVATGYALEGFLALCFSWLVVGYNATLRLVVGDQRIELRRYGLRVWSFPKRTGNIRRGRVGDLGLHQGYAFETNGKQVGYLLDGWFAKEEIQQLLRPANSAQ